MELTKTKYDKIMPFYGVDYTIATINGKAGMIDLSGNPITQFIYDDLSEEYINYSFDDTWSLYQNCCSLRINNKWGLLDTKGNIIVDFKYDSPISLKKANDFLYAIELNDKTILYNNQMQKISDTVYDDVRLQSEECLVYELNGKCGILDGKGNVVTEPIYDKISSFLARYRNNMLVCNKNGLYGVVNYKGETIIECKYNRLSGYSVSGKYFVAQKINSKNWGLIDTNNNIILDFIFDKLELCSTTDENKEYIIAKYKDNDMLFDMNGNKVI